MKLFRPNIKYFKSLIGEKPTYINICSPWISEEGINLLKDTLFSKDLTFLKSIEIWFRLTFDDFIYERMDYYGLIEFCDRLIETIGENILFLRHSNNLHAKIYRCDNSFIIGSANLTKGGFYDNIEIAVQDKINNEKMILILESIRTILFPINLMQLKMFIKMCEKKNSNDLRMLVNELKLKLQKIQIPNIESKVPPHFKIPW